ncbi:hypothetical protein PGB28_18545 [Primorskyibacter aestuariivivens]|uniref:hypothetical protein n=1 Tax=Primorskyibacter aestuariivivens TaxID=1888912 RepID=UPI002301C0B4|nr:hypothetical protein [Primorskyibacter aestuariivivens]MDA7430465.1 hypothetical protein [Primorskyibacter aestuariivivens]
MANSRTLIQRLAWLPVLLILMGGGIFLRADSAGPETAFLPATGQGPLDGMIFTGMLGPDGQPKDVEDTFVFAAGNFLSKECELRCDYPAKPYAAERTDTGWQFESLTKCPYKDATIHWRGTIVDDTVTGIATWTMKRWYWTIERDFAFEAQRVTQPAGGEG